MNRRRSHDVRARLRETYVKQPQIGLVLGAGVTVDSRVPDYPSLALRVFQLADGSALARRLRWGSVRAQACYAIQA